MYIAGLWSGHDASFCILRDGIPIIHAEYERFLREKEPKGDSVKFMYSLMGRRMPDIRYAASCFPSKILKSYKTSFKKIGKNTSNIYFISHHLAHAANAFFSSNIDESLILTLDGGGADTETEHIASACYYGKDNGVYSLNKYPISEINIGAVWTRCTRYIFNLQSGWPYGHQAGTVMAMASLGEPKYHEDFIILLTNNLHLGSYKPPEQPSGANVGTDPKHPYLGYWREMADTDEQSRFDIAASLQSATETIISDIINRSIKYYKQFCGYEPENLCLSGGVALNSVAVGKIAGFNTVYVPPTPHDGGLSLGAAQFLYHMVLDKPRIRWNDCFSPYLGISYGYLDIVRALESQKDSISYHSCTDTEIISLLCNGDIVAIFNDRAESGRRALGNRSILADPRNKDMKDRVNDKVKHRLRLRPFAPSILREHVQDWFTKDIDSPYMSHVIKYKDEVKNSIPAVVHADGTGRLQTVTRSSNAWYYNLLQMWYKKTGIPILLNTSFNDREPICETPEHAINCFLSTEIDHLYFPEHLLIANKKS
jgi:carbamoyltransferase